MTNWANAKMAIFLKGNTLMQIILSLNILVLVAAAYSDPDVIPGGYIVEFADQQNGVLTLSSVLRIC